MMTTMYKEMTCEEIMEMGNVALVDGMINSVSSKKSRNRNSEEIVRECEEILEKLKAWKEQNGCVKSAKRGKYDDVDVRKMSDGDLADMYESLYSRRCYYKKIGNTGKFEEMEHRIDEVKAEKKRRKLEKLRKELMEK